MSTFHVQSFHGYREKWWTDGQTDARTHTHRPTAITLAAHARRRGLMKEVETLMGYHKLNATAYHPHTDGLVERYNRTLTSMLPKTVTKGGPEWDEQLPYVLFTYRASQHASTQESPFDLLYGHDHRLPVPDALSLQKTRVTTDLHEKLTTAWELARKCVGQAQERQKNHYDKKSTAVPFRPGERVFLYKPVEETGEARKLACPFHGQYRIADIDSNTATITRIDRPEEEQLKHSDVVRMRLVLGSGLQMDGVRRIRSRVKLLTDIRVKYPSQWMAMQEDLQKTIWG